MAERAQIIVKGIVQGVGFRPYVYNLAGTLGLKGYVTNTSEGVLIDIEGAHIPEFIQRLRSEAPPLSHITDLAFTNLPVHGYTDFTIQHSLDQGEGLPFTLISPDVSICDDCLRELLDPSDKRYLYPFINCTNCGPRYSITKSVPYDRPNTTMASFHMCRDCEREYLDPKNRRFHAQPNACAECGPGVEFRMRSAECTLHSRDALVSAGVNEIRNGEAIKETVKLLKNGGIVAVKGLGGFHIACDATNQDAVKRLRERKRKSNKPFAVMSPDRESINNFCVVTEDERNALRDGRRPIVLLKKKEITLPDAVSPNNKYIGCMLPYTPLHYLLFYHPPDDRANIANPNFQALVMTSGNLSEEPIVSDNEEAALKLSGIVDGFLLHNRDIFMRVDDSVIRIANCELWNADCKRTINNSEIRTPCTRGATRNRWVQAPKSAMIFIRRSRGYAPDPIMLHDDGPEVLGCGADLKNTFTLTKGRFAITSQHIGDMENYETLKFYEECLANLKTVYRAEPVAIVHDLHPGYLSTQWAIECGLRNADCGMKTYGIQHHYAHIGSVMAEHGLTERIIGVAFDGTGYGTDGNLWGSEFLVADIHGFERAGQFKYIPLPGGEAAIKEPWRVAVSYLVDAAGERSGSLLKEIGFVNKYGEDSLDKIETIAKSRDFSPLASGAGRLFDAVSAMLGLCDRNTFEGEAAMALESLTREDIVDQYVVELKQEKGYTVIDYSPTIHGIVRDMSGGISKDVIATKFHNTVATTIHAVVRRIRERTGITDVALSGGAFQNLYLLKKVLAVLAQDGLNVYTNHKVPCNDACISLGQAYLVRERMKKCGVRNAPCTRAMHS